MSSNWGYEVVATIAFGLGIDKGEVRYGSRQKLPCFTLIRSSLYRYIIHYDIPASFEGENFLSMQSLVDLLHRLLSGNRYISHDFPAHST